MDKSNDTFICDICKKEVKKTNKHTKIINGKIYTLCGKHYSQYVKHNTFLDNSPFSPKDKNLIITDKKIPEISYIITHDNEGNKTGKITVDTNKVDILSKYKWRLWDDRPTTNIDNKPVQIYHLLLPIKSGYVVDHINHDPTDNRLCNLRMVTQQQNTINQTFKPSNKTGVIGVYYDNYHKAWAADIKYKYISYKLGYYNKFEDAVYARYVGELILYKEYRNTSNDDIIFSYINMCNNKDYIKTKVKNHINKRNEYINIKISQTY